MTQGVQTSGVPAIMDAIVDRLRARDELAGVSVSSGPLAASREREGIELWNADAPETNRTTGRRKTEDVTIQGQAYAARDGSSEQVIRAARDRVFALVGEIAKMLRESEYGARLFSEAGSPTAREAYITNKMLRQGSNPDGVIVVVEFVISAKVDLNLF